MTFYCRTGALNKPVSGTTPIAQDSPALPEAPKALLLWSTSMWNTNSTAGYTDNGSVTMGFSDGTNHMSLCAEMEDGGASSSNGGWIAFNRAINLGEDANDDGCTATFSSTKFTLNWQKITSQANTIFYCVWGGTDITNVTVGTFNAATATGNSTTTGTAFTPDIEMYLYTDLTTTTNGSQGTNVAWSFGAAKGSGAQFAVAGASRNGQATMDTYRYATDAKCVGRLIGNTGALDAEGSHVAFTTTGRTINFTNADTAANKIMFMAIKGGSWAVGDFNLAAGTGTSNAVTGLSFTPEGCLMTAVGNTANTTTPEADNRWTLGVAQDATTRNCVAFHDNDGTANAQITKTHQTTKLFRLFTGAATAASSVTEVDVDISSFPSNGITINRVTNTGTLGTVQAFYIAWAATAGAGPITMTESAAKTYSNKFITKV